MSERPLPPNRRVAPPKAVVEAPDEMPPLDEQPPKPKGRVFGVLRAVAGVLFALAISIGCVVGLVRYTHTSPRFAIQTIEVTGTVHRTPEQVTQQGKIHRGDNVFALDLDQARANILEDPFIESVTIVRKLPGTLRIDVTEREPAAVVSLAGVLYLATREGEVFKKVEPGDPIDFPVITGIAPELAQTDREGMVQRLKRAIELAADYERIGLSKRYALQEIHVPDDGTTSLVVGKEGIVLRLGKEGHRQALERASQVLQEVTARRARASIVFLDNEAHPERVVVRMR